MNIAHVFSVSTGKDSTATLLMGLERGVRNAYYAFADTGHEHDAVYRHLEYLEARLGIKIDRLRRSFDEEIAARRLFVARDARVRKRLLLKRDETGRVVERRVQWVRHTNKAKRRILSVLHPTGNPYLDLCLWKGRFPSRRAQFCTQFLKTEPLVEYQLALIDTGAKVISWQGIRREESENRKDAKKFEYQGGGLWVYRPIVDWSVEQVFAIHRRHGIEPNPLYLQGMTRVGCMPCINCSKAEVANTAKRFPAEIDRIAAWERLVAQASKRGEASFFPAPDDGRGDLRGRDIHSYIQWARTARGGRQVALDFEPSSGCASSYGLCDT